MRECGGARLSTRRQTKQRTVFAPNQSIVALNEDGAIDVRDSALRLRLARALLDAPLRAQRLLLFHRVRQQLEEARRAALLQYVCLLLHLRRFHAPLHWLLQAIHSDVPRREALLD